MRKYGTGVGPRGWISATSAKEIQLLVYSTTRVVIRIYLHVVCMLSAGTTVHHPFRLLPSLDNWLNKLSERFLIVKQDRLLFLPQHSDSSTVAGDQMQHDRVNTQ